MPYEVEVRVSDCVLARAAAGRELLLRNGDETDVAEHSLPYEPALLADLVATGCPG